MFLFALFLQVGIVKHSKNKWSSSVISCHSSARHFIFHALFPQMPISCHAAKPFLGLIPPPRTSFLLSFFYQNSICSFIARSWEHLFEMFPGPSKALLHLSTLESYKSLGEHASSHSFYSSSFCWCLPSRLECGLWGGGEESMNWVFIHLWNPHWSCPVKLCTYND